MFFFVFVSVFSPRIIGETLQVMLSADVSGYDSFIEECPSNFE